MVISFGMGVGYRDADIAVALVGGNPDNRAVAFSQQNQLPCQGKDTGGFEADIETVPAGELFRYFQQVFLERIDNGISTKLYGQFSFSAIGSETMTFEAPFLNAIP